MTCLTPPKVAHITPFLLNLHWLPIKFKVEFKIVLLVFKALHGIAPCHISETCSRLNMKAPINQDHMIFLCYGCRKQMLRLLEIEHLDMLPRQYGTCFPFQ